MPSWQAAERLRDTIGRYFNLAPHSPQNAASPSSIGVPHDGHLGGAWLSGAAGGAAGGGGAEASGTACGSAGAAGSSMGGGGGAGVAA